MDSGLMYNVYLNQASGAYLFFYFFNFFYLQFQNIKIIVILFLGIVRPTKLKRDTHMGNGLIYCVYQNQAACTYLFLCVSSFFLSLQLGNIKNVQL